MRKVVAQGTEEPAAEAAAGLNVTGFCSLVLGLLFLVVCRVPGLALADANGLTQRDIVKRAMEERPSDPWPRGKGHVVLGIPGSQQPSKAYHEPGGSFSPAVGSFGVSIWITDRSGAVRATSDSIPLDAIRQRLAWPGPEGVPAVLTETPYYRAQWSCSGPGRWTLDLNSPEDSEGRLVVVIRSVGPAGGAIQLLKCSGQRL